MGKLGYILLLVATVWVGCASNNGPKAVLCDVEYLLAQGEYETLLPCLDSMLATDSNNYDLLDKRVGVLLALGRFEEAIPAIDRIIEYGHQNPNSLVISDLWYYYSYKSYCYANLGLEAEALAALDAGLKVDSSFELTSHMLVAKAVMYRDIGKPKEFMMFLDSAVAFDPYNWNAYHLRGEENYRLGYYNMAQFDASQMIELDSFRAEGYSLMGRSLYVDGVTDTAFYYLLRAGDKDVTNPKYPLELAVYFALQKEYDLACVAYARVQDLGGVDSTLEKICAGYLLNGVF